MLLITCKDKYRYIVLSPIEFDKVEGILIAFFRGKRRGAAGAGDIIEGNMFTHVRSIHTIQEIDATMPDEELLPVIERSLISQRL